MVKRRSKRLLMIFSHTAYLGLRASNEIIWGTDFNLTKDLPSVNVYLTM